MIHGAQKERSIPLEHNEKGECQRIEHATPKVNKLIYKPIKHNLPYFLASKVLARKYNQTKFGYYVVPRTQTISPLKQQQTPRGKSDGAA